MPIYAGAAQRLLTRYKVARGGTVRAVVLHSTAGGATSPHDFFAKGSACSHFWVGYDGDVEQYLDTDWKDAADLYSGGGPYVVSIETASNTAASDEWTAAQLVALANLIAWICDTHDVEVRASGYAGDKGIGWHRLGIHGNWPAGRHGGLDQVGRGDVWSTSRGKTCPGDKRIDQAVDVLIPLVAAAVSPGGPGASKPVTPSTPAKPSGLDVDGRWGESTTRRAQHVIGTPADGEVWNQYSGWRTKNPGLTTGWKWTADPAKGGSPLILAMQRTMKKDGQYHGDLDGLVGPEFAKGLQRRYGTTVDGELWDASPAIKGLQRALNAGRF